MRSVRRSGRIERPPNPPRLAPTDVRLFHETDRFAGSPRSTAREEIDMTASYTFDVFCSLDGYGAASANWSGYWGKQGPELLEHRLALYGAEQRMVFGANTYRAFARMLAASSEGSEVRDPC